MSASQFPICQRCQLPGRCCTGLMINNGEYAKGYDAVEARAKIIKAPQLNVNGDRETWDLRPLIRRKDGTWLWWCASLVKGRCSIYSHRPKGCKDYIPQTDDLCYHFDPITIHLRPKPKAKGQFVDLLVKEDQDQDQRSRPKIKTKDQDQRSRLKLKDK